MRFGWCTDIGNAQLLHDAGFDYIEGFVTSLCLENEQKSQEMIAKYKGSPIPPESFCIFLPGDMKVVGPDVDIARIKRYVSRTTDVLGELGTRVLVFGSGGARRIPEGWERDRAEEQIVEFLNIVADECDGTPLTLAIEPLNKKESNILNSIAEAVELARKANRRSVRVLADFYHMAEEDEPLDTLVANKEWLAHIHVADTGRLVPGTGSYPYREFAANLRAAGYSGRISVECRVGDLESEAPAAIDYLRKIWSPETDETV